MKIVFYKESDRKTKRYSVLINKDKIHFGSKNGKTFIDHQDEKKRENYIKRHKELNEDWTKKGIRTAGYWSRWLLWEKPTLQEAIDNLQKKHNISIWVN